VKFRGFILFVFGAVIILSGCKSVQRVKYDIPIEERDKLKEEYIGKKAWTRSLLIDLGDEGIIDRDTEVKIVDLDMHWQGAVMVQGPKRKKITHGLLLERPLTKEIYDEKLHRLFWFDKPEKRYRMDLRKYGKKTAKAIFNHELFKGMKRDAALSSWGYPDEINSTELGGSLEEQWIYLDPRQKGKKRYIYIRDGLVSSWEE
jgi:hypothetical protein